MCLWECVSVYQSIYEGVSTTESMYTHGFVCVQIYIRRVDKIESVYLGICVVWMCLHVYVRE